jgi:hypothetical protein
MWGTARALRFGGRAARAAPGAARFVARHDEMGATAALAERARAGRAMKIKPRRAR